MIHGLVHGCKYLLVHPCKDLAFNFYVRRSTKSFRSSVLKYNSFFHSLLIHLLHTSIFLPIQNPIPLLLHSPNSPSYVQVFPFIFLCPFSLNFLQITCIKPNPFGNIHLKNKKEIHKSSNTVRLLDLSVKINLWTYPVLQYAVKSIELKVCRFYVFFYKLCFLFSFSMTVNKSKGLQWVIDVTIAYPKAKPMDIQTWIFGYRPPTVTHVHYR